MTVVSTNKKSVNGHPVIEAKSDNEFEYVFVYNDNIKVLSCFRDGFSTNYSCNSFRDAIKTIGSL